MIWGVMCVEGKRISLSAERRRVLSAVSRTIFSWCRACGLSEEERLVLFSCMADAKAAVGKVKAVVLVCDD